MISNSKYKLISFSIVLPLVVLFASSCTKENVNCYIEPVNVVLRAQGLDDSDLKNVTLYVFDDNDKFLKKVVTGPNEKVFLDYQKIPQLHLVGFGNGEQGGQLMPDLAVGTHINDAQVRLLVTSRSLSKAGELPVCASPNDLFLADINVDMKRQQGSDIILPMKRQVAGAAITLRNLKAFAESEKEEDYRVVVRETYNSLDFLGNLFGDKISYRPLGSFNNKDEYVIPLFNLFPSALNEKISIDIFCKDVKIITVDRDKDDKNFVAQRNKTLNVLVDLTRSVDVSVTITPWKEVYTWKEFN